MSRTRHHGQRSPRWAFHLPGKWPTPMWFVREFMNRPKRHRDRRLLRRVACNAVDADNAAFAVGNRRPHVYFW